MSQEPASVPFSEDFASWIAPLSTAEFVSNHWLQRPFFSQGSPSRLKELAQLLGPFEVGSLLRLAEEPLDAWYVDKGIQDFSLSVGRDIAPKLYRAGLTLYFHLRQDIKDHP